LATHREDAHSQPAPTIPSSADQRVLLERYDQPINDRASDTEAIRQFGDREALAGFGHLFQNSDAPIQGLGGFRGHTDSQSRIHAKGEGLDGQPLALNDEIQTFAADFTLNAAMIS
jgi:hypothetical protein